MGAEFALRPSTVVWAGGSVGRDEATTGVDDQTYVRPVCNRSGSVSWPTTKHRVAVQVGIGRKALARRHTGSP
jgi:hypothetical protein